MLKKVLIASLFIGGGVFFIKNILPKLTTSKKSIDADFIDIDELWLEREQQLRELDERTRQTQQPNEWLSKSDKEKIQEELKKFWNPNDLQSYSGLKNWTLGLPNITIQPQR